MFFLPVDGADEHLFMFATFFLTGSGPLVKFSEFQSLLKGSKRGKCFSKMAKITRIIGKQ